MKTISARAATARHDWYLIDARGQVLGRMAGQIANRLRGKHKPEYTPHVDTGDYIVVINAGNMRVTGRKPQQKLYHRHSGYPGGLKSVSYEKLMARDPTRVLRLAVRGMMPKNRLSRAMLRKLKIYSGSEHPHAAQQPKELVL